MSTAYVVRCLLGGSIGATVAAVGCCYLGFSLATLATLGPGLRGALGCAGMLVPAVAAVALASSVRR